MGLQDMRYWLGLGSNIGNRAVHLAEALRRLARHGVQLVRLSPVYETAPLGITNQPDFYNMVAEVEAQVDPAGMVALCLEVETEMGRVRQERWGPRTIDIDVLIASGAEIATANVQVPHPRLTERQFVLVPLADIAPGLLLPDGRRCMEAANPHGPGVRRAGRICELVRKELFSGRCGD
ncbi:MAG: 2-amino-4-hydroxy-6-hydroxymethyldihydropteridine diphosphokinase [Armatimonadetes bacterium]|nr:2-amino-4-hydroxy-6-hydroxymethyldihydropteridine diphosphokinase [Armatimonadota bacterium]